MKRAYDPRPLLAIQENIDEAIQSHPQKDALLELAEMLGGPITVYQAIEGNELVAFVDTGRIAGRVVITRVPLEPLSETA